MENKKIRLNSEAVYALAVALLSLSVAMITSTSFGVSMIVAPAYILSRYAGFLTFGQCEYIVQGILFTVFCILMKKVKITYFSSFVTGLIYGAFLDLWRLILPHLNPAVTPPGSLPLPLKIVYFALGMAGTSFSIMLFYRTYLYPQVYDFFVKGVSTHFGIPRGKFKICFDCSCLAFSVILTLVLFHGFVGVGIGTLIMTAFNGLLISLFGKLFDRFFVLVPAAPKFAAHFALD